MSVAWILKEKGRNVSSVLPARSLNETITVLARNRIGAVVVADEAHHILGIISERDIVRIIATQAIAIVAISPRTHSVFRSMATAAQASTAVETLLNEEHPAMSETA